MLGLSTEHITRFKTWVTKWSKWRGLSMSEWIDIGWLRVSRTFLGTQSTKLVNTNNSNRDHLIHWFKSDWFFEF